MELVHAVQCCYFVNKLEVLEHNCSWKILGKISLCWIWLLVVKVPFFHFAASFGSFMLMAWFLFFRFLVIVNDALLVICVCCITSDERCYFNVNRFLHAIVVSSYYWLDQIMFVYFARCVNFDVPQGFQTRLRMRALLEQTPPYLFYSIKRISYFKHQVTTALTWHNYFLSLHTHSLVVLRRYR